MIKNFQDLIVWQKAHNLTLEIYKLTNLFPKYELFGLTSQIRRATVSIESNIAEGFSRKSSKESKQFYYIANSSLEEVKCQLIIAKDLNYIRENQNFIKINSLSDEVGKLLFTWIKKS